MKYLRLIFIFSFILFLLPQIISAQEVTGEHIQKFSSDITVNKDGTIAVVETIVYDFGNQQRHGIFWTIPVIKKNDEGKKFRLDFTVNSVFDENGNAYSYTITKADDELKIKIGDANIFVTGVKTYVISYEVSGALTYFSDHDELYWNVNGTDWDVSAAQVNATVNLPDPIQDTEIKSICYTGSFGESESDCQYAVENRKATFQTIRLIGIGEGMTINVSFPKNVVAVLEPKEVISFWNTGRGKFLLFGFLFLGVWWYLLYPIWILIKWFLYGRDPLSHIGKLTAHYDPPKTKTGRFLTPAETGTLVDERVHMRDISAMMVHLAQRGLIKIVENDNDDYSFVKLKDFKEDKTLLPFERHFLQAVFSSGKKIRIKDAKLAKAVEVEESLIHDKLVDEGLFSHNPNDMRSYYSFISGISLLTFNMPLAFSSLIFGQNMPRKTLTGVVAQNYANSLKNFLLSQERQLEFQAKNQMFFEKLLPYAIAFGVEKIWADRFKDIAMKPPTWYEGTSVHHFNSTVFTNSLNSSFAQFSRSATPTRSSSGFFSGSSGGFSGGGGGGGGGGSW